MGSSGKRKPDDPTISELKNVCGVEDSNNVWARYDKIHCCPRQARLVTTNATSASEWCHELPNIREFSPAERKRILSVDQNLFAVHRRVAFVQFDAQMFPKNNRFKRLAGQTIEINARVRRSMEDDSCS